MDVSLLSGGEGATRVPIGKDVFMEGLMLGLACHVDSFVSTGSFHKAFVEVCELARSQDGRVFLDSDLGMLDPVFGLSSCAEEFLVEGSLGRLIALGAPGEDLVRFQISDAGALVELFAVMDEPDWFFDLGLELANRCG